MSPKDEAGLVNSAFLMKSVFAPLPPLTETLCGRGQRQRLQGVEGADSPTPQPSTISLGRINHHSPSLNATSAQNSQSWQRCQEALGGGWVRSAHRRALQANAHRSLAHKGARYPRHAGLPGSPPHPLAPSLAAHCCPALPRPSCRRQMEKY